MDSHTNAAGKEMSRGYFLNKCHQMIRQSKAYLIDDGNGLNVGLVYFGWELERNFFVRSASAVQKLLRVEDVIW